FNGLDGAECSHRLAEIAQRLDPIAGLQFLPSGISAKRAPSRLRGVVGWGIVHGRLFGWKRCARDGVIQRTVLRVASLWGVAPAYFSPFQLIAIILLQIRETVQN